MGEEHVGLPGQVGKELPVPEKQVWVSRTAEEAAEGEGTARGWGFGHCSEGQAGPALPGQKQGS